MKKLVSRSTVFTTAIIPLVLFLFCGAEASAQESSLDERFGLSASLLSENQKGHDFSTVELQLSYDFTPSFSVFVPFSASTLYYNKTTTKNYDLNARCGLGLRLGYEFASKDRLAFSLSGQSTVVKSDMRYWMVRLMAEYLMHSSIAWNTVIGVGVEYLSPYNTPSVVGGFYPVVTIGVSF